ncbi:MAG TPA: TetR/AcrR family transcriptional regulator, partial [Solirubrobacterales bacterium]|nr:TetR/AcrR family transcriptional regulator [Solirubrobacterales bacterium]
MPRTPLSRERVLRTAMALADADGIERLSMRKLAGELGVEAMSLYHHVAGKDEILSGIVDLVLGEIELPASGADWKETIRRSAISAHAVFSRHPWACRLVLTTGPSPARLRFMDSLLASLREGGFPPGLTYHGYHALDSHIMGFTLWQGNFPASEDLAALAADFLRDFPTEDYPDLAEHIEQHVGGSGHQGESDFEFVLDLILDGLER